MCFLAKASEGWWKPHAIVSIEWTYEKLEGNIVSQVTGSGVIGERTFI